MNWSLGVTLRPSLCFVHIFKPFKGLIFNIQYSKAVHLSLEYENLNTNCNKLESFDFISCQVCFRNNWNIDHLLFTNLYGPINSKYVENRYQKFIFGRQTIDTDRHLVAKLWTKSSTYLHYQVGIRKGEEILVQNVLKSPIDCNPMHFYDR